MQSEDGLGLVGEMLHAIYKSHTIIEWSLGKVRLG